MNEVGGRESFVLQGLDRVWGGESWRREVGGGKLEEIGWRRGFGGEVVFGGFSSPFNFFLCSLLEV